jgi:hypothetical protein
MKTIKIKIEHSPAHTFYPEVGERVEIDETYTIVSMTNAAKIKLDPFKYVDSFLQVGSRIPSDKVDEFARDRRFEVTIVQAKEGN